MTPEVLTVEYDMPPAEVITTMTRYDVSAVAVVDAHDSVLGIITRTDVLNRIAVEEPERVSRPPWRRPVPTPAFTARSAGEMMSAPALTVAPDVTLAQAARLMRHHAVNRLLVIGPDRRLLGIVTAADLLDAYHRPDEEIRAGVRKVLALFPTRDLAFGVHDGVVTMAGTVAQARTATLLERLVRDVPGVTAVHSEIAVPAAPAPRAEPGPPPQHPLDGWWTNRRPGRATAASRRATRAATASAPSGAHFRP